MNRSFRIFSFALLLVLLVTATGNPPVPAYAAYTTLNTTNQGWLQSSGFQIPGNTNYLIGYSDNNFRDFFVFDLSSVSDVIVGATLRINVAGYSSPDESETVEFYDVSTPISALTDGTGGTDAFIDLGTGIPYGSVTITAANGYSFVEVPLNADGVAAVGSALGGQFALGGALSTYGGNGEYVFGDSMNYTVQLILITDNTPPVVFVPRDMRVEAEGSAGAVVDFTVFAIDETAPMHPAVDCDTSSGAELPLDSDVMISCSANDYAGNTGYGSFNVQVVDTTPPVVLVPSDSMAYTASPSGAAVSFSASAADLVDGLLEPSCNWPSGATFPVGTTLVTCSSMDAHSNLGSSSFNITINQDADAPDFSAVTDNPYEATGPSGATVNFNASFSDSGSGMASSSCAPASGSLFPLGATTVNCTGTDNVGNTSTSSFEVMVQDTTAPFMLLPGNMIVGQSDPGGAVVTFEVAASDLVSASPLVECTPLSGSIFSLGTTTVDCSASDEYGNTSHGSFDITVSATSVATFYSIGKVDGTITETRETSNVGAYPRTTYGYLDVGDGRNDVQVLSILHFDTSSLPDDAVITGVTLRIKQNRILGDPFSSLGDLLVDIASPFFGAELALKPGDFQTPASADSVGFFNTVPLPANWFEAVLQPAAYSFLNTGGTTQFRLRFALDDNDNLRSDLFRFFSGDSRNKSYLPVLVVEYYVPAAP